MDRSFDLSEKLRRFAVNASKLPKELKEGITENVTYSCEVMKQTAMEHTPNEFDGKPRGFNVISNSLYNSWDARFEKDESGFGKVVLENKKSYAKWVQDGHRVKRHFVPWLYKDEMGTLSYETDHNQPLFGLVVGTKTKYVKGIDMVGPAIDAFNDTFEEETRKLLESKLRKL